MDDIIIKVYSGDQLGGALPFFAGSQQQWGGGILNTIARYAFPILRRVLGVATNTAEDVLVNKKKLKDSIIQNTVNEISDVVASPTTTTATNSIKRKSPSSSINPTKDTLSSPSLLSSNRGQRKNKRRRRK